MLEIHKQKHCTSIYLSKEYLGGTEEALSLKGVAEFRVKNDDEKVKEGGTDDDLAYLDASN